MFALKSERVVAKETERYFRLAVADSCFSPGAAINRGTLFAGRTDQIRRGIDAVFSRGTHAIIFGEAGVGKTSLANCLADFMPNPREEPDAEPLFLTPRVNCNSSSTYDAVWREVFRKINFTQQVQQAGFKADPDVEIKNYATFLPEKISPSDVQYLLELAARKIRIIVVIDEFDKVLDAETKNLMAHTIKALSDHSVDATILIVGVGDTVDDLIAEHQSIQRCLREIAMPRMSLEDVRDLVKKGIRRFNSECEDFPLDASDDALTAVATLSRGMPHYAHLLAQQACCMAVESNKNHISRELVLDGMHRSLAAVEQSRLSLFLKATSSSHKNALYREVLTAAAITPADPLGFFSPGDVQKPLAEIAGRAIPMGTYMKHINEFVTEGRGPVLEKRGEAWRTRFRFCDPLMQPYVVMRALGDGKLNLGLILQTPTVAAAT